MVTRGNGAVTEAVGRGAAGVEDVILRSDVLYRELREMDCGSGLEVITSGGAMGGCVPTSDADMRVMGRRP